MKELRIVFCILVITTILHESYGSYGSYGPVTTLGTSYCPSTPTFNALADYIKLWVHTLICHRNATAKATLDSGGRYYLSFQAPLDGEKPDTLCDCMRSYWFQGPWTKDAKSVCFTECDTLVLLIIGSPQPEFIGAPSVLKGVEPIDALSQGTSMYPNGEVWLNHKCTGTAGTNEQGYKHITWICDYTGPNLPTVPELCPKMYDYIDGGDGNLLRNTVNYFCWLVGKNFYLNIVAKNK